MEGKYTHLQGFYDTSSDGDVWTMHHATACQQSPPMQLISGLFLVSQCRMPDWAGTCWPQATLQTMTEPNASGGANAFLGTLVLGLSAVNGARTAYVAEHPHSPKERDPPLWPKQFTL